MTRTFLFAASLLIVGLGVLSPALAGANRPTEEDSRHYAGRGVSMMMDGDLDGAIVVAQQIQQKDPDSPLGFILGSQRNLRGESTTRLPISLTPTSLMSRTWKPHPTTPTLTI